MSLTARFWLCLASSIAVSWGLHAAAIGQTMMMDGEQAVRLPRILDVSLTGDGLFVGRVLDRQGQLVSKESVALHASGMVLRGTTDDRGRFRFANLRGGVYSLSVCGQKHVIRVWSAGTAPPIATREALLIVGSTVRGQLDVGAAYQTGGGHYDGTILKALSQPWLIAGLTGAAIAIPLAVDDDDAS